MSTIHLSALKGWQLKYWAFLTGAASTGTKAELQSVLNRQISQQLISTLKTQQRIVSVDMGIRNLAFCALETSPGGTNKPLTVTTWKRMDLLSSAATTPEDLDAVVTIEEPASKKTKAQQALASALAREAFTPSSLSRTAYGVTTELLELKPSTILIERQRFRSGGASTILEWTIRVNMLESMLYACLETLRASTTDKNFPDIQPVNPARVANFWAHFWGESLANVPLRPPEDLFMPNNAGGSTISEAVGRKVKVDKKGKVAIVKSWVMGESKAVSLAFEGQAAEMAAAFRQNRGGRAVAGGKLDDLADCLLQAVAWARWQENQREIHRLWQSAGGTTETVE